MRGGLVVCIGDPDAVSARLRRVASRLRWHHGRAEEHVLGRLTAILFVDDGHGPALEQRRDRAVISHGGLPQPLSELHLGSSRFAALEWDGRALRASRDPLGEVLEAVPCPACGRPTFYLDMTRHGMDCGAACLGKAR